MKVIAVYDSDGCLLYVAKNYKTAVGILFNNYYISETDELMIDGEWTTLKDYFGGDIFDIMTNTWDIDDFNEFWNGDFKMEEYKVLGYD